MRSTKRHRLAPLLSKLSARHKLSLDTAGDLAGPIASSVTQAAWMQRFSIEVKTMSQSIPPVRIASPVSRI